MDDDERERDDIDERIRAALALNEETVGRVVRRALAAEAPATRRRYSIYALGALAVTVLAVLAVINLSSRWRAATPPPIADVSLSITGRGSLLAVEGRDGRRWIVGAPPDRTPRGTYVIVIPQ